jgi:hypothetical protein
MADTAAAHHSALLAGQRTGRLGNGIDAAIMRPELFAAAFGVI